MRTMRTVRTAFTIVELSMGLVIMALVMGSIAAVMGAVGQSWSVQETTQSTQLQANQVYTRVQRILAAAKYVGQYQAGAADGTSSTPGSIFFWRADDYPGSPSDLTAETGEMGLIAQDPATHSLWYYRAIPYAQMNASQLARAGVVMHWVDLTNPASPGLFKGLDFVQAQALGGPGNQVDNGTRLHVIGAQFNCLSFSNSATQLPVIEFALGFTMNGQNLTIYNSATLRGPTTQPIP